MREDEEHLNYRRGIFLPLGQIFLSCKAGGKCSCSVCVISLKSQNKGSKLKESFELFILSKRGINLMLDNTCKVGRSRLEQWS